MSSWSLSAANISEYIEYPFCENTMEFKCQLSPAPCHFSSFSFRYCLWVSVCVKIGCFSSRLREALSSAVPAAGTSGPGRVVRRQPRTWWSWASPTCVWSEATAAWPEPMTSGLSGVDCCSTWSKLVRRQAQSNDYGSWGVQFSIFCLCLSDPSLKGGSEEQNVRFECKRLKFVSTNEWELTANGY